MAEGFLCEIFFLIHSFEARSRYLTVNGEVETKIQVPRKRQTTSRKTTKQPYGFQFFLDSSNEQLFQFLGMKKPKKNESDISVQARLF